MDLGLRGKKALITGATRGIGRAIAEVLIEEGCDVALCSRKGDAVDKAVDALSRPDRTVWGAPCDVGDDTAFQDWLDQAVSTLGGADIFIPNVSAVSDIENVDNWQTCFNVDMMHTVRGCQAMAPHLAKSGDGAIVLISSIGALEHFGAPTAYNALKAALLTYSKQLAKSVGGSDIRVNAVSPGPILCEDGVWDRVRRDNPDQYKAAETRHPAGRLGTPEEVARAVVFLASPAASWITGTNLIVDGGFTERVQF